MKGNLGKQNAGRKWKIEEFKKILAAGRIQIRDANPVPNRIGTAPYHRFLLSHVSPAAQASAAISFVSTSSSPSSTPEPPTTSSQLHPGCVPAENCAGGVPGRQGKSDKRKSEKGRAAPAQSLKGDRV
jgi:hypothetical protein